jgi:hypothetical protein
MKKSLYALGLLLALPVVSQADIIDFDFTGRLIVADLNDTILINNGSTYTDISASLTYDTLTGIGSSDLSISMSDPFLGMPATFHDISMTRQGNTDLITGEVLVDWGINFNMPLHIEWDATGLFKAIDFGLRAGDVLSGSDLYHDANSNGVQDLGEFLLDISSAIPYSDSLQPNPLDQQGPAPLAATSGSIGLGASTPFPGMRGFFDIGSGNSMHVTSVLSVPVPAAVWLFGSGLLGLIGIARRKKAT